MSKRFWLSLITAIFTFFFVIQVSYASESGEQKDNVPENAVGILTDKDGQTTQVKGKKIDQLPLSKSFMGDASKDPNAETYAFGLKAGPSGKLTVSDYDSTDSVKVYLTISYSSKGSPKQYRLNKVSGHYQIEQIDANVTSNTLTYGTSGAFLHLLRKQELNM